MTTVAATPAPRKPAKVFYAHLDDQPGALTRVQGIIYFVADAGEIIEITPAHITFLVVLGEMQLADAQRIEDLMHGGAAGVACSRAMEVS
jgi:hypothetical protein